MTTYFCRLTGSDSNAGTSAAAAFRTISKALSTVAAGDVVCVGAGTYREVNAAAANGAAVGGAITAVSVSGTTVTVTTTSAHGLAAGQYICITGVVGNSGLNGFWKLDTASGSSYSFTSLAAGGTWASGGATEQLIAFIGDLDGAQTGDAGPVILSPRLNGEVVPGSATPVINLSGTVGYYFEGLILPVANTASGTSAGSVQATTTTSQFIGFRACIFPDDAGGGNCACSCTVAADTPAHWLFDRCIGVNAFAVANTNFLAVSAPNTATAADYNLDITFLNCTFYGYTQLCSVTNSTSNTHKAGGIQFQNCTGFGLSTTFLECDLGAGNPSSVIPHVVLNCVVGGRLVNATGGPQTRAVVEDYNQLAGAARTSVFTGMSSSGILGPAGLCYAGQEAAEGGMFRPPFSPMAGSPLLGWGQTEIACAGVPGTITDDNTVGTISWTNPGNAGYPDGTAATAAVTLAADTHYLNLQNYSWDRPIPSNAVIDGIAVQALLFASAGSNITPSGGSAGVKLIKGGVIGGRNHTNTGNLATLTQLWAFGGPADLWGQSWTAAEINGSGFGVALSLHGTAAATADVDYVSVVVYYHLPVPSCSVDLSCRPRPAGSAAAGPAGTATSGGTATLTDSGATWGVNQWAGWVVTITAGTGAGQYKPVKSNTLTALTVISNWATAPDSSSVYALFHPGGGMCETGKFTSGSASTATISSASWQSNQWAGFTLEITGGTGSGQKVPIGSNTATILTIGPNVAGTAVWVTNPDSTSTYALYRGAGGAGVAAAACGAYERHDTAAKDTAHADAGSCWALSGPGDQEVQFAVDASTYTVSVKVRTDGSGGFGAGFEPQAVLLEGAALGVTAQTVTAVSPTTSYQTLTFSAISPTAKGVVRVRLVNRTTALQDTCYFDTFAGV